MSLLTTVRTDEVLASIDETLAGLARIAERPEPGFADRVVEFDPFDQTPTAIDGAFECENV